MPGSHFNIRLRVNAGGIFEVDMSIDNTGDKIVVFAVDDHAEARREAAAIGGIYWYRHRRYHYDRLHF